MKKICLTLALVFLFAIIFLSGCNGKKNSNGSGSSTPQISESSSNAPTSDFNEEIINLDNKTIKLATFWADWTGGDSATPEQQECAKALAEIEKEYNCKIELVALNGETYAQDINTAAASGVIYANILELQLEHLVLANAGNLKDVSTIKSLGIGKNKWDDVASDATSVKNKQFGVGYLMSQQESTNRNILVFNKKLIEDYSLENPYDLVKSGDWTFDKFTKICEDVVSKSSGKVLGMIDQYGQGLHFLYANGGMPVVQDGEKYKFNYTDKKMITALQFLQTFNEKGLYNLKDYKGQDFGLTESNVFMARKTLFFNADYWTVPQIFSGGMPDDYGVLPFPKGPDANSYTTIAANSRFFSFIEGDPDVEAAGHVMTAIANRCHLTKDEWIQKQAEVALRDDESIEMLEIILESTAVATRTHSGLGLDFIVATNTVIYDMAKTPKQALDEVAQICQAKLDESFNQ